MAYVLDRERSGFAMKPGWPIGLPGLAEAVAPFGGDPALQQWATELATIWATRMNKPVKEIEDLLDRDMKVTLAMAYKRWKGASLKRVGGPSAIIRAWKIRQEQLRDFVTLDKSKWLVNFRPPPAHSVQLMASPLAKDRRGRTTPLIEDEKGKPARVAPLVVAFMQKLRHIHPTVRADTYPNHGGGAFSGRGFSIDLWLDDSPKDTRGFWIHQDAVALLRAVHQAARAVRAEWRVIYNDYSVARVINKETGARRVIGLGFHGPYPLVLHFHLDLEPLPGVVAGASTPMFPSSSQSGVSKPSVASSIASLPKILADGVRSGALTVGAVSRILAGEKDVNTLTNLIFYARHPELPTGYKIQPHEKSLAREWLHIRERVVRPVLGAMDGKSTSSVPLSTPTATAPGPLGTLIAEVPGRPRFSYAFTPEDLLWTARFLKGEAGGENNLDSHAVIWAMFNRYALLTHKYFPTFHQFIRAYSTPLQPVLKSWGAAKRHMHKKTFVRTGGTYAPKHPEVPKGQLHHHLELQNTPWNRLPQGARIVAEASLTGQLKNPIGLASEFGSTYVYFHDQHGRYPSDEEWRKYTEAYARGKKWVWVGPVPGLNQKDNALFTQAAVAKLSPDTVRVVS